MIGPLCPRRQRSFRNSRPADSFTFLVQSGRISRVSPVTEARSFELRRVVRALTPNANKAATRVTET